jgi:hypothetical protein
MKKKETNLDLPIDEDSKKEPIVVSPKAPDLAASPNDELKVRHRSN